MVPEGWEAVLLGDLADFKNGLNFNKDDDGHAVKVVGIPDFWQRTELRDFGALKSIKVAGELDRSYHLESGDLLFVRSNGNKDLIGRCMLFPEVSEPISFSGFTIRARVDQSRALPAYIGALMTTTRTKGQFSKGGGGTNISNLSQGILASVRVDLPPLAEQKKIAEILSTWDRAIEVAEAQLDCARTQKRALMQQLLTGRRRFPEFEGQEWKEVRLGDVIASMDAGVSVNSGDKPAGDTDFGVLKTSSVSQGVFDPSENKIVDAEEEIARLREPVSAGTTVMSRMNTPALVGANGYVSYDMPNLFLPDRLWAIRVNHSVAFPAWVGHLLASGSFRYKLSSLATGTSGSMKNITKSDVRAISIRLPPLEEQKRISQILDYATSEIDRIVRDADKLRTEKKALMQQLLTGKRRVSV